MSSPHNGSGYYGLKEEINDALSHEHFRATLSGAVVGRVSVSKQYIAVTTVIRFFSSSKILSKKYSRKIIFGQTKLNENNFTSCVWWALVEEITPCRRYEKEMACCVRGYHVYKDIWAAAIGEVLVVA